MDDPAYKMYSFTFPINKVWEYNSAAAADPILAPGMVFLKIIGDHNPVTVNGNISHSYSWRDAWKFEI